MQSNHYTWYGNANAPYREPGEGGMEAALDWLGDRPRVLYITPDYPDYQADLLFHGLSTVLGRNRIVVHPPRPQYNVEGDISALGVTPNLEIVHFRLGEQRVYKDEEVVALVGAGVFDLVVVSRPYYDGPSQDFIRKLLRETDVEFVVLDDDSTVVDGDAVIHTSRRLLDGRVRDYFMKEWRRGSYPHIAPLQFAYPETSMPVLMDIAMAERTIPFNFVCRGVSQMRVEVAETLRPLLSKYPGSVIELSGQMPHEEYRQMMASSRVTVSAMGTKFDCPRFYEAMAFGTALVTQKMLIDLAPCPRVGEDYQVFRTLDGLPGIVEGLLEGNWAGMALSGREFFLDHYTTAARAKQFLGHFGLVERFDIVMGKV